MTEARLRLAVVDDHPLILEMVESLLEPNFEIVGKFIEGHSALEAVLKLQPDVIVMDISMPGLSGIEVAREMQRQAVKTRIVFLTIHEEPVMVTLTQEAGGLGYVVKSRMATDLEPAIQAAVLGQTFVSGPGRRNHDQN